MSHYQVTLNKGRTDTVTVEANSLTDVKTFFQTVSNANITMIKKIVYSKDLGIGTKIISNYIPNNENRYLNIMVKTSKGYTTTLNLAFPIKNITKDKIIESIKKNILVNDDNVVEILNIMKSK